MPPNDYCGICNKKLEDEPVRQNDYLCNTCFNKIMKKKQGENQEKTFWQQWKDAIIIFIVLPLLISACTAMCSPTDSSDTDYDYDNDGHINRFEFDHMVKDAQDYADWKRDHEIIDE